MPIPAHPANPTSLNALAIWPWVEKVLVEAIANGEFDINHLLKLHREEEFHLCHIKATVEGVLQPFDKSKTPEVLIGRTKIHTTFKDPATFFSAWQVYTSICSFYHPERGPGLALFAERIYYHIHLNYSWNTILNYILAFFRKHQNSAPEVWNDVDPTLVANNLAVTQQKPPIENTFKLPPTRHQTGSSDVPIEEQVCHNWNRREVECKGCSIGCRRRHVCSLCEKADHRAFSCSVK